MSLADGLRPLVQRYAREVTNRAGEDIADRIRKAAPVHKPDARDPRPRIGGRLAKSIERSSARERGSTITTVVSTEVDYASFQDQGTKGPYMIFPKRAGGRLVFFWPRVGRVVAFRQVRHPGIRNPSKFWSSNTRRQDWEDALGSAARETSVRG